MNAFYPPDGILPQTHEEVVKRTIHHYWFDKKDETILAQGNREFEQIPPAIQLSFFTFK